MAENSNTSSDSDLLDVLDSRSDGTAFADEIFALVDHAQFFAEFNRDDIAVLASYLRIYYAQPGQAIIREGDIGDYMLLLISGEVGVSRKTLGGEPRHLASVTAGMTLGEMSMIDGQPRFASCVALKKTTFGVLTRDNMGKIILENPSLGAKILIRLVTMLSQRLRHTTAMLLQYMH